MDADPAEQEQPEQEQPEQEPGEAAEQHAGLEADEDETAEPTSDK